MQLNIDEKPNTGLCSEQSNECIQLLIRQPWEKHLCEVKQPGFEPHFEVK